MPVNGVSSKLFHETYNSLSKSVDDIFKDLPLNERINVQSAWKRDIARFSAYKAHHFTQAAKEDRIKAIKQFREQLKVEKNHVAQSVRSAKQWRRFQQRSELYPNIKYNPSRSVNPRESHKKYYGLVLPINDPFWTNVGIPPLDWNCNCYITQVDDEVYVPSEVKALDQEEGKEGIVANSWKEKRIFSNKHPYWKKHKESQANILSFLDEAQKDLPLIKIEKGIQLHPLADPTGVEENIRLARAFYEKEKKAFVVKGDRYTQGVKNPEYLYEGGLADLKAIKGARISGKTISDLKRKGAVTALFYWTEETQLQTVNDLFNSVKGSLQQHGYGSIETVKVLWSDGEIYVKTKSELQK